MPRNVYSEINLHLTGHTKANAPVLVDQIESRCHKFLTHQCLQTPVSASMPLTARLTTSIWWPTFRRP